MTHAVLRALNDRVNRAGPAAAHLDRRRSIGRRGHLGAWPPSLALQAGPVAVLHSRRRYDLPSIVMDVSCGVSPRCAPRPKVPIGGHGRWERPGTRARGGGEQIDPLGRAAPDEVHEIDSSMRPPSAPPVLATGQSVAAGSQRELPAGGREAYRPASRGSGRAIDAANVSVRRNERR